MNETEDDLSKAPTTEAPDSRSERHDSSMPAFQQELVAGLGVPGASRVLDFCQAVLDDPKVFYAWSRRNQERARAERAARKGVAS